MSPRIGTRHQIMATSAPSPDASSCARFAKSMGSVDDFQRTCGRRAAAPQFIDGHCLRTASCSAHTSIDQDQGRPRFTKAASVNFANLSSGKQDGNRRAAAEGHGRLLHTTSLCATNCNSGEISIESRASEPPRIAFSSSHSKTVDSLDGFLMSHSAWGGKESVSSSQRGSVYSDTGINNDDVKKSHRRRISNTNVKKSLRAPPPSPMPNSCRNRNVSDQSPDVTVDKRNDPSHPTAMHFPNDDGDETTTRMLAAKHGRRACVSIDGASGVQTAARDYFRQAASSDTSWRRQRCVYGYVEQDMEYLTRTGTIRI